MASDIYYVNQHTELNNAVIVPIYIQLDRATFFRGDEMTSIQLNIKINLGANYWVTAHNTKIQRPDYQELYITHCRQSFLFSIRDL